MMEGYLLGRRPVRIGWGEASTQRNCVHVQVLRAAPPQRHGAGRSPRPAARLSSTLTSPSGTVFASPTSSRTSASLGDRVDRPPARYRPLSEGVRPMQVATCDGPPPAVPHLIPVVSRHRYGFVHFADTEEGEAAAEHAIAKLGTAVAFLRGRQARGPEAATEGEAPLGPPIELPIQCHFGRRQPKRAQNGWGMGHGRARRRLSASRVAGHLQASPADPWGALAVARATARRVARRQGRLGVGRAAAGGRR